MNVNEFQKKIIVHTDSWDTKRKVIPNEQMIFNHIMEEIGELAYAYGNRDQRKEKFKEEDITDAIGDILIQTIRLAGFKKLDIEKVVLDIINRDKT